MSSKEKEKTYFSFEYMSYLLSEMNKYPLSYILYAIPSIMLILLVTTLFNYINFVNREFVEAASTQALLSEFNSYIILIGLYIVLYYLTDTMVAHFSYNQFKYKLSIPQTFLKAYKTYPKYLVHRVLQLLFMSLPLIIGFTVIIILSEMFNSLFGITNASQLTIIIFLLLIIILFVVSFLFSIYYSLKYAYLAVSVQFSEKNNFLKVKEYHHSIRGHFKSIIIRVLILVGLVVIFNIVQILYDYIISFVGVDTLVLVLQIIGVLLSMFVFYFVNAYLFFSYKDEFYKKIKSKHDIK